MSNREISDFEKKILNKIDNTIKLTQEEIAHIFHHKERLEDKYFPSSNLTMCVESIVAIGERTFQINGYYCPDNLCKCYFRDQHPIEVKKIKRMVEDERWVVIRAVISASL